MVTTNNYQHLSRRKYIILNQLQIYCRMKIVFVDNNFRSTDPFTFFFLDCFWWLILARLLVNVINPPSPCSISQSHFTDNIKSTFHIYGTFTNINFIFVHLKVSSHLKISILKMSFNAMLTSQQFIKTQDIIFVISREGERQEAIFCFYFIHIYCLSQLYVGL